MVTECVEVDSFPFDFFFFPFFFVSRGMWGNPYKNLLIREVQGLDIRSIKGYNNKMERKGLENWIMEGLLRLDDRKQE